MPPCLPYSFKIDLNCCTACAYWIWQLFFFLIPCLPWFNLSPLDFAGGLSGRAIKPGPADRDLRLTPPSMPPMPPHGRAGAGGPCPLSLKSTSNEHAHIALVSRATERVCAWHIIRRTYGVAGVEIWRSE